MEDADQRVAKEENRKAICSKCLNKTRLDFM
jgi:hypothetical protein